MATRLAFGIEKGLHSSNIDGKTNLCFKQSVIREVKPISVFTFKWCAIIAILNSFKSPTYRNLYSHNTARGL